MISHGYLLLHKDDETEIVHEIISDSVKDEWEVWGGTKMTLGENARTDNMRGNNSSCFSGVVVRQTLISARIICCAFANFGS